MTTAKLIDPTGREHAMTTDRLTIGRAVENDVVITSKRVSREHARVRRAGWRILLEDLGSTNGTYLNGERLHEPVQLRDGDQIKVGDVLFTFYDPDVTTQESPLPELEIDVAAGVVRLDRQRLELAPKEYALLVYLHEHSGMVCAKDEIGTAVWPEYASGVYDYQIENLVRRLRTKLEADPANPQRLLTVRGRGYQLLPG
jgi:DNA-binding response OmpR family regulator